jgi:hypothetical protein
MLGVFKRKSVGCVAIAILTAACSTTPHAEARKLVAATTSTTVAPTTTTSTTTTLPPTTTTTVLPTTTTTITTGMVPNATELGGQNYSIGVAEDMVTRAGFTVQVNSTTVMPACYTYSALGQQPVWNTNEVIGQYPSAGTVAPIGSTVQLEVCGPAPP